MGLNCLFVAKAQTLEEVTQLAIAHVLENHKADFNSLQSPEEIEKMKQALLRSTRVAAGKPARCLFISDHQEEWEIFCDLADGFGHLEDGLELNLAETCTEHLLG